MRYLVFAWLVVFTGCSSQDKKVEAIELSDGRKVFSLDRGIFLGVADSSTKNKDLADKLEVKTRLIIDENSEPSFRVTEKSLSKLAQAIEASPKPVLVTAEKRDLIGAFAAYFFHVKKNRPVSDSLIMAKEVGLDTSKNQMETILYTIKAK